MNIIKAVKLPKEVEEEFIRDLKRDGTASIIGVGRFTVSKYTKKMPLIPDAKGRMILSDKNEFSRISFKPSIFFKKAIE